MTKKKKKDITLEQARELFRYENGKLYWEIAPKCCPRFLGKIAGTRGCIIPKVNIKGKYYYLHRIVYLLHHGFCPQQLEFKNKTLTSEGMYDISIENLFEPPKNVVVNKPKKRFRKELSYFEVYEYLEYKNGRLYWKAKPFLTPNVVAGNLVEGTSDRPMLRVKLHGKSYPVRSKNSYSG